MNENIEYINPNVMFELGYALQLYGKSNIILLLDMSSINLIGLWHYIIFRRYGAWSIYLKLSY